MPAPSRTAQAHPSVAASLPALDAPIRFATGSCALGTVLVAHSPRGLCALWLGDSAQQLHRDLQQHFAKAQLIETQAELASVLAQVQDLLQTPSQGLTLPLDTHGTPFQERVWQALRAIPAGTTVSYAQLAAQLQMPTAVRALAQACAANRIAVAIPCHRVVRSDGQLAGYRWGVERKRALLLREARGIDSVNTF